MVRHHGNKFFQTDSTLVHSFIDTIGFEFGTVTVKQGKFLIPPLNFGRKAVIYNYACLVNVFPIAHWE